MTRVISRSLSLLAVAAALFRAWEIRLGIWYVVLEVLPILSLIWFPEVIDDLTFGTWRAGYRVDSHTPTFMIASVGWLLLFLSVFVLFDPDLLARLFGVLN